MHPYRHVLVFIAVIILAGCLRLPTLTPTITPTEFIRQPEPQQPLIFGNITGVPEGIPVRIYLRTPKGWEAVIVNREGSGKWETVVTDGSGVDYIVTAEALDFISTPISYSIHLEDIKVYLLENGVITDKEAVNLDFHFKSN